MRDMASELNDAGVGIVWGDWETGGRLVLTIESTTEVELGEGIDLIITKVLDLLIPNH